MYSTPGKRRVGTPSKAAQPPDGPIADLQLLIEESSREDWQRRVKLFEELVEQIPDGSLYLKKAAWFNTPKTLSHLASPVSELLKDPRSTVVRRVCAGLTNLFNRCQSDARLLFKDIMPTILGVHAQTVQIIRQAVQSMVSQAIPEVPCKSVMPMWMERLKDKSPMVRDACSLYLGLALQSWTSAGYLTDEIWTQVGTCLLKTLRDPSPTVRLHAKTSLLSMRQQHPSRWDALVSHPAATKDPKLMRWLKSLDNNNGAGEDELSVASKYTLQSRQSYAPPRSSSVSPRNRSNVGPSYGYSSGSSSLEVPQVPFQIAVTHKEPLISAPNRLGPPLRPSVPSTKRTSPPQHSPQRTPPRPPAGSKGTSKPSPHQSPVAQTYNALAQITSPEEEDAVDLEYSDSNHQEDTVLEPIPSISSMTDLKTYASKRRGRNSMLMQERFRKFSIRDEQDEASENTMPNSGGDNNSGSTQTSPLPPTGKNQQTSPTKQANVPPRPSTPESAPEHICISIRLLRAHKAHVDGIMETLKMEMDTLRDFDRLLEEAGRPTEEELLNYYESVDLCLEQRLTAAQRLRSEMDRISRGLPAEL